VIGAGSGAAVIGELMRRCHNMQRQGFFLLANMVWISHDFVDLSAQCVTRSVCRGSTRC